jgi:hypothetical protein
VVYKKHYYRRAFHHVRDTYIPAASQKDVLISRLDIIIIGEPLSLLVITFCLLVYLWWYIYNIVMTTDDVPPERLPKSQQFYI